MGFFGYATGIAIGGLLFLMRQNQLMNHSRNTFKTILLRNSIWVSHVEVLVQN